MWFYMKNQQQIGPMRWEDLMAAARDGRLQAGDAVWTEGMPQWQPAGTVAGLFATAPMPGAYAPQGYGAYSAAPAPVDPFLKMALPIGRSVWAIVAGYCGIFALFCLVPAPLAIIFGFLALNDIKQNPEKLGKGRAIFGIVMGVIGTVLMLALLIMSMSK